MAKVDTTFWKQIGVLALVVMALYSRVADFPFVNYDDSLYFYENRHVTGGLTAENARWAFEIHGPSMWIPLTWLSHQTMVSLFGGEPGPHHILNGILHALNSMLLLLLLRRMTGTSWRPFAVALLFAIHPLHAESVAWVTERKDVLALAFSLGALLAYEKYSRGRTLLGFMLVALLHAFAVMAKPLAVTLPCIMFLCDFWPFRAVGVGSFGEGRVKLGRALLEKVPLLAISALASYLTVLCQLDIGAIGSADSFPLGSRIGNALVVYVIYLRRLFWPTDLAVFYPYRYELSPWAVAGSSVVLLGLLLVAWRGRKSCPAALFGLLWFFGSLVPMIGLVQAGAAQMADRYAYLSFLGLYIALVWGAFFVWSRLSPKFVRSSAVGAGVFLLWLLCWNWRQVSVWRSSEALFSQAISVTSENYLAHNNLGLILQNKQCFEEARAQFERSLRVSPNYPEAHNNLGILEARLGNLSRAKILLGRQVRLKPAHAAAWHNLAKVHAELGERESAVAAFQKAIQLGPDFVAPRYDLACLLLEDFEKEEVIRLLGEVVRLEPSHSDAWVNLGVARVQSGDSEGGIQAYQKAVSTNPQNSAAYLNLAVLSAQNGRKSDALRYIGSAASLGADSSDVRRQLGESFRNQGDYSSAHKQLKIALQLDEDNTDALNDLGVLLGAEGNHAAALRMFQRALEIDPDHVRARQNLDYAKSQLSSD